MDEASPPWSVSASESQSPQESQRWSAGPPGSRTAPGPGWCPLPGPCHLSWWSAVHGAQRQSSVVTMWTVHSKTLKVSLTNVIQTMASLSSSPPFWVGGRVVGWRMELFVTLKPAVTRKEGQGKNNEIIHCCSQQNISDKSPTVAHNRLSATKHLLLLTTDCQWQIIRSCSQQTVNNKSSFVAHNRL